MGTSNKFTPGPWIFYADTPSTDPNWHIVTNESRMRVLANVHIEPGNENGFGQRRRERRGETMTTGTDDKPRPLDVPVGLRAWIRGGRNRQLFLQEGCILSVTEEIWRVMEEKKVTKADLARHLGCSKAHVTQLLNGGRNMTLRTLSDICMALDVKPVITLQPNARRIIACVNACEGIPTEHLEQYQVGELLEVLEQREDTLSETVTDNGKLLQQRDELLAALNHVMSHFEDGKAIMDSLSENMIRAAITKATGSSNTSSG